MSNPESDGIDIAWQYWHPAGLLRMSWNAVADYRLHPMPGEGFEPNPSAAHPGVGKLLNGFPGISATVVAFDQYDEARSRLPYETEHSDKFLWSVQVEEGKITTLLTMPASLKSSEEWQRDYFRENSVKEAEIAATFAAHPDAFQRLARPLLTSRIQEIAGICMRRYAGLLKTEEGVDSAGHLARINYYRNRIVGSAIDSVFLQRENVEAA